MESQLEARFQVVSQHAARRLGSVEACWVLRCWAGSFPVSASHGNSLWKLLRSCIGPIACAKANLSPCARDLSWDANHWGRGGGATLRLTVQHGYPHRHLSINTSCINGDFMAAAHASRLDAGEVSLRKPGPRSEPHQTETEKNIYLFIINQLCFDFGFFPFLLRYLVF